MANHSITWHVSDTCQSQNETLAECVANDISLHIEKKGSAVLCVPGGRTPSGFLDALSRIDLEWSKVKVLLNDERCVSFDDGESNQAMLVKTFQKSFAGKARFVPLYQSSKSIEKNVADFNRQASLLMPIDVCILGMGTDGHTASLFPGTSSLASALDDTAPAELISVIPENKTPRLSLNLSALLSAQQHYVLIRGEEKRRVAEEASRGDSVQQPISYLLSRTSPRIFYTENTE